MTMKRKAFVLLSGGLDSTTCLYKAIYDFSPNNREDTIARIRKNYEVVKYNDDRTFMDPIYWVEAISINYGQRHLKESEYARKTCEKLGIKHTVLDIGNILAGASVMLTNESRGQVEVPDISYSEIRGVSPTYVPYRNGTMLSVIAAHAQKWVNEQVEKHTEFLFTDHVMPSKSKAACKQEALDHCEGIAGIYFGAHSEDAAGWAYPDCTPEFIGSQANAIYIGSYRTIRLYTPLQWLMKKDIVALGHQLGVPFEDTWSCYKGEELHCGVCPTCRSRREAFIAADVCTDPTQYATEVGD